MKTVPTRIQPVENKRQHILHALEHAAHLLPAQGPIGVFIHHNTLHGFQHLQFEAAVCEAANVYGTEPYLREEVYRSHLKDGRIYFEDVEVVLEREGTEVILPGRLDTRMLRKKLLFSGQRRFEPCTIQWHLDETDLLQSLRPNADPVLTGRLKSLGATIEAVELRGLFASCQGMVQATASQSQPPLRLRDKLLPHEAYVDLDEIIHPLLIRLCGAFLDQGMAYWPMPNRQEGFLRCVGLLLSQGLAVFPEHLQDLGVAFRKQSESRIDSVSVVISVLSQLGLAEEDWDGIIQEELLALPGWAGMMNRLEHDPDLAPHQRIPCSLADYLAVRLTIEAVAVGSIGEEKVYSISAAVCRQEAVPPRRIASRKPPACSTRSKYLACQILISML